MDFNKNYKEIKDFDEKLSKMKFKEYVKTQREMYKQLTLVILKSKRYQR
jgi:hypothetical protein